MNDNRRKLTGILKLLYENTDAEHSMDTYQIMDALESMGDGRPDRKTIESNIKFIIDELGFGIIKEKGKPNRYRWARREFDLTDLTTIADAVHTAKFIPEKKSREIIAKLKDLTSVHQASLLNRDICTSVGYKRDDTYANPTATMVSECIRTGRRISFQMADYDADKNEYLTDADNFIEVSPYLLVWDGEQAHMIGRASGSGAVSSYSLLQMRNISQMQIEAEPAPKGFSPDQYTERVFDMFRGDLAEVQLSCRNSAMKQLMFKFGRHFQSEKDGEDRFTARVKVDISPSFFAWVFRSCGDIKIVGPASVKNEYGRMVMDQLK